MSLITGGLAMMSECSILATPDRIRAQHPVAPDRPILRCKSSQQQVLRTIHALNRTTFRRHPSGLRQHQSGGRFAADCSRTGMAGWTNDKHCDSH